MIRANIEAKMYYRPFEREKHHTTTTILYWIKEFILPSNAHKYTHIHIHAPSYMK